MAQHTTPADFAALQTPLSTHIVPVPFFLTLPSQLDHEPRVLPGVVLWFFFFLRFFLTFPFILIIFVILSHEKSPSFLGYTLLQNSSPKRFWGRIVEFWG